MVRHRRAVTLVGCGREKQDEPAPAREFYTSSYFKTKVKWADAWGDGFVLSAKHGVVGFGEVLEPYDERITDKSESELETWVENVRDQLYPMASLGPTIIVLAASDYVEPLREVFRTLPAIVATPFDATDGLPHQMGWMNETMEVEPVTSVLDVMPDGFYER